MNDQVLFLNMFSDMEPPEELKEVLSQAVVFAADIDPEYGSVSVRIRTEKYIPMRLLDQVRDQVMACYGLRSFGILATHPSSELHCIEPSDLKDMFVFHNSMNMGSLAGARWEWDETTLTVHLSANGVAELEECVPFVKTILHERFDTDVEIRFVAGNQLEGKALFEAMERIRSNAMVDLPRIMEREHKPEKPVDPDMIYGKPFKGKAVPMKELSLDMGSVIVEGKVFAVDLQLR